MLENGGAWSYTILSVLIVSLISFVGVLALAIKKDILNRALILLVSLSAGVMLGDAFLHLIPEAAASGFSMTTAISLLSGITLFFILEKLVQWKHCHHTAHTPEAKKRPMPYAVMNIIGDGLHNFIDGILIAGSYLVNVQLGIATTIAVVLHEIPQEIGDFGVLLHGGFKKTGAIIFNFLTGLTALIGAIMTLLLGQIMSSVPEYLIPFTAGGFIYIAASDLIPQIHSHNVSTSEAKQSALELLVFILGMVIMYGLLFLE